jgi:zinc-finger-containing domain
MSYYDDNEDKHMGASRRRFFGNRSPKKQAEVRQADRRAMHVPPEAYLDRKALKAAPGSPLARTRIEAHDAFDPLWKSGTLSRRSAYDWLAIQLHLPVSACHMVLLDVAMCQRVVAVCAASDVCRAAVAKCGPINDFEDLTK